MERGREDRIERVGERIIHGEMKISFGRERE